MELTVKNLLNGTFGFRLLLKGQTDKHQREKAEIACERETTSFQIKNNRLAMNQ